MNVCKKKRATTRVAIFVSNYLPPSPKRCYIIIGHKILPEQYRKYSTQNRHGHKTYCTCSTRSHGSTADISGHGDAARLSFSLQATASGWWSCSRWPSHRRLPASSFPSGRSVTHPSTMENACCRNNIAYSIGNNIAHSIDNNIAYRIYFVAILVHLLLLSVSLAHLLQTIIDTISITRFVSIINILSIL